MFSPLTWFQCMYPPLARNSRKALPKLFALDKSCFDGWGMMHTPTLCLFQKQFNRTTTEWHYKYLYLDLERINKFAKMGDTSGTNVERMRTCTSTTQDTGLVPAILATPDIFCNKVLSYTIQSMYFKVDVKNMKKVGHRCWIARGAQSELWFYEEEMLCYVNEKIIWEGWKSLGRRCLGQGGDSQIYEGDKGVWGCQQATKRGRSLQKCKTRKSWRERKDPNPPRWWLLVELELGKQAIRNYWRFFKKR